MLTSSSPGWGHGMFRWKYRYRYISLLVHHTCADLVYVHIVTLWKVTLISVSIRASFDYRRVTPPGDARSWPSGPWDRILQGSGTGTQECGQNVSEL